MIDGVELLTLAPDSAWTASLTDPNLASTIVMVTFGRVRVLLTGDAEAAEEQWLLSRGVSLEADVLKVAHHGSYSASSPAFLDKVAPAFAVISCGADNPYGHPHKETIDNLNARGIKIYRTDLNGTIMILSNGTKLTASIDKGKE